jgi:GntR family transcriptional regulator
MTIKATFLPPINRLTTAVPLYNQIAESLLDQIETGHLEPGSRLQAERELSEMLGVNRMTLRQALQLLESQGLLVRRQGDGTYVAQPKLERQAGRLISFTRGMRRRGFKPGAKVISFEEAPAEASVAAHLNLRVSTPIYRVHRLRLVNGEPVLLERFTIPMFEFPRLEQHDLVNRSMYEIMEKEYGVTVNHAQQSLEPVLATEYEAGLLEVPVGVPLFLESRLSFDKENRPVEYGKDLYRGDRWKFVTEIASLEL